MPVPRRQVLALSAVLAATALTGGGLAAVLASHPAAPKQSVHPTAGVVVQAPAVAAPIPVAFHEHEQERGDR